MSVETHLGAVSSPQSNTVLCVDLDGTLIKTDVLWECICKMLKVRPWYVLLIPFWLLRGRPYLKERLGEFATFDPNVLPYNMEFLRFLQSEHKRGREIVLATASARQAAERVASHVGLFSSVYSSGNEINLKGRRKLALLTDKYAKAGFCYAGNETADLKVWEGSTESIVVNADASLERVAKSRSHVVGVFDRRSSRVSALLRALRLHQWAKNLLIFVPPIMAHRISDTDTLIKSFGAFIAFGLCASSVYLLNDLLDIEADRHHPRKRHRPFASGDFPISKGFLLIPVLLFAAGAIAYRFCPALLDVLPIYYAATLLYSFVLKSIALIDILVLAGLYTIRIFAGGHAAAVPVSPWLLAFSLFFFFGLACAKRYSELYGIRKASGSEAKGRGYLANDLEQIAQFGSSSGYISVLVLALYINSSDVTALYSRPQLLWLLCPIFLYWISRVWLIAHRGHLHEDPVVFAIRDRVSYVTGLIAALCLYFAI